MKKFFNLIVTFVVAIGMLGISWQPARAALGDADEANLTWSAGWYENLSVVGRYGQTFQPDNNRLTTIAACLRNEQNAGGWTATMTLKDHASGEVLGTSAHRLDGNSCVANGDVADINSFEYFSFPEIIPVIPGHTYSFFIDTAQTDVAWGRSNANSYSKGKMMFYGSAKDTDDFIFAQWGYTFNPVEENEPNGDESVSNETTKDSSDTDGAVEKTTKEAEAEVDQSIKTPKLEKVVRNDRELEITDEMVVNMTANDTVVVSGTAFKDAAIAFFLGDTAYEVTADNDGKWNINIPFADLSLGENLLKAQAKTGDKGSEIVELLTIRKIEDMNANDIIPKAWFMDWTIFHTLITVGLLLLVALLLGVVGYRHHKTKGKPNSYHLFGKKIKTKE